MVKVMRKQKNTKLYAVFAVFAMLLIGVALYFFLNASTTYTLKEQSVQPSAGELLRYEKGSKLSYEKDHTIRKGSDNNEVVGAMPIYEGIEQAVLPRDMIYINARKKQFFRLNHFQVLQNTNQGVKVNGERIEDKGCLYDGEQTYVFLEDAILTVNGEAKDVPALSSIQIDTKAKAYILYNADYQTVEVQRYVSDDVIVRTLDYRIDLVNSVLNISETKILLYNNVSDLDDFK